MKSNFKVLVALCLCGLLLTTGCQKLNGDLTDFTDKGIIMAHGLAYGTYQNPHELGESVYVAFTNDIGRNIDYHVSLQQVLSGSQAIHKAQELGAISSHDQEIMDSYDIYMVQYKITYSQSDMLDPDSYIGAVDSSGESVELDLLFSYHYNNPPITINDNSKEGWAEVIVEKGTACKLALFIGSEMVAPGIVATFYFDLN